MSDSVEDLGAKLLSKFGYTGSGGLGRNNQGVSEPILPSGVESGRMGLGKSAAEDKLFNEVAKERRKMDAEKEESEDMWRKKAEASARQERTMNDVKKMNEVFFCDICKKQYKNVAEMTNHLSSMDHHHAKRLKELKRKPDSSTGTELRRREEEREAKMMDERIRKANSVSQVSQVSICAEVSEESNKQIIQEANTETEASSKATSTLTQGPAKVSFSMSMKKKK